MIRHVPADEALAIGPRKRMACRNWANRGGLLCLGSLGEWENGDKKLSFSSRLPRQSGLPPLAHYYRAPTLTHGCLKVHGEVPIVLCIFVDPL